MSGWVVLPRVLNQFGRVVRRSRLVRAPGRVSFRSGLGTAGKIPRIFSASGRTKVMPRMFRRGYGLGGGVSRFRKRRAFGKRRVGKKTQNKVHTYIRWCDKDTLYPGSTGPNSVVETLADQHLAYSFKLDNVVNPSDFTNLYDMYRINKVTLYLEPTSNQTAYPVGAPISRRIRVVHDYNDNNALPNEDNYLEYSNCKSYNPIRNSPIAITLYPKINNKIENAGGSDAFTSMNSNRVWLNIDSDDVPHFGIKIFIPGNITVENGLIFKVRAKFHLSMKNSK